MTTYLRKAAVQNIQAFIISFGARVPVPGPVDVPDSALDLTQSCGKESVQPFRKRYKNDLYFFTLTCLVKAAFGECITGGKDRNKKQATVIMTLGTRERF